MEALFSVAIDLFPLFDSSYCAAVKAMLAVSMLSLRKLTSLVSPASMRLSSSCT